MVSETNGNKIRIIILNNNALIRAGLRLLIERQPGMEVIGEFENSVDNLDALGRLKPDIVLLEFNRAQENAGHIVSEIKKRTDQTRVIILADATSSNGDYLEAIRDGAVGVILKTQAPEVLYKAITKVHAGEVWLERTMIASLLTRLSRGSHKVEVDPEMERVKQLSNREKQIIQLIGGGQKNKQIALSLCISETTVRHHLTSIFSKLDVSDRLELLIYANRVGLAKMAVNPLN